MSGSFAQLLTSDIFNRTVLLIIDTIAVWLVFRVYKNNPKGKVNRLFAIVAILFLFWVNGGYFFAFSNNLELSLILGRVILGVVIWSFIFLYLLLVSFPIEPKKQISLYLNKFVIFLGLVFSISTSFTSFIVKEVKPTEWGIDPVYTSYGKLIYYLVISFLMAIAIYQMLRKYPRLSKNEKSKYQYFFMGIFIFVFSNFLFNVFLPLWRDSIKYWQFGNYAAIFLLGFTAYAIIEHKLLDIKVVATEFLTLVIWAVLLSKVFVSQSVSEMAINLLVLLIVVVFGIFLIRSVMREVGQREKLETLTNELKEMDRQKDEFVSMAAHELRAPLSAIKGYLSMIMAGDTGEIPEKARQFLADANTINDRLVRLVNNMLNVSRIEGGRMVYQMEVENLSRVIRAVFSQFRPEAERKDLKFSLEIPREIKDRVEVDPDRIHEVIANLLSNAIKYTDKGSVVVRLCQPGSSVIRVEVIDTGPGISKEEQKKLFKKFSRAESSVGKTTGTGLGLYISKLLVEKFNGKIGLNSQEGKGSNFWFELPIAGMKEEK